MLALPSTAELRMDPQAEEQAMAPAEQPAEPELETLMLRVTCKPGNSAPEITGKYALLRHRLDQNAIDGGSALQKFRHHFAEERCRSPREYSSGGRCSPP